jgi:2-methylaconitate cis-trans-isomerase PrpF
MREENIGPCSRGGTSKALIFHLGDLPADRSQWDHLFLRAIGSPDPYGRQLDGMGGGVSSLSKICIVGPATRPDADVDYTFAQVQVKEARGSLCVAVASAIPGTLAARRVRRERTGSLRLGMPSGVITVDAEVVAEGNSWRALHGAFYRTTRRLFEGLVYA